MFIQQLMNGEKDIQFPPKDDLGRLQQYKENELLFLGKHKEVFNPKHDIELSQGLSPVDDYISCNYAGIISRTCADFLFGEPIEVMSSEPGIDKKVKEIISRSNLDAKNAESALAQSYKGDIVIKARYKDGVGSFIEYSSPDIYFPEIDPDNVNELKRVGLAWIRHFNDERYLRVEIHEVGKIYNKLFHIKDDKLDYEVPLELLYDNLDEVVDTGIDQILVRLIPNFKKVDTHFGLSDYYDLKDLFKAINNRVSRISSVQNRHSDPILAVPKGVLDEKGQVKRGNLKMFEITSETQQKPEYIVWDAKLDFAFKEIEVLEEMILKASEISQGIFGTDKGGVAESGRALKFKLLRTLAKIKRKQRYYNIALEEIFKAALALEGVKNAEINIKWNDGIPQDEREEAETNEILIRSDQMSIEEAVKQRHPEFSDEEVQEEIEKIKSNTMPTPASGIPGMTNIDNQDMANDKGADNTDKSDDQMMNDKKNK